MCYIKVTAKQIYKKRITNKVKIPFYCENRFRKYLPRSTYFSSYKVGNKWAILRGTF